jgi:hypothetical protein
MQWRYRSRVRRPPLMPTAAVLGGALALGACGDDGERVNNDRPPAPINVTAAVIDGRVHVSPRSFGAGPIRLIVSNQTGRAQAVTLETADVGSEPGITQTTPAIQPRDTGLIEADVPRGAYALRTDDRRIRPAAVRVGAPRPSAQDDLLLP